MATLVRGQFFLSALPELLDQLTPRHDDHPTAQARDLERPFRVLQRESTRLHTVSEATGSLSGNRHRLPVGEQDVPSCTPPRVRPYSCGACGRQRSRTSPGERTPRPWGLSGAEGSIQRSVSIGRYGGERGLRGLCTIARHRYKHRWRGRRRGVTCSRPWEGALCAR